MHYLLLDTFIYLKYILFFIRNFLNKALFKLKKKLLLSFCYLNNKAFLLSPKPLVLFLPEGFLGYL